MIPLSKELQYQRTQELSLFIDHDFQMGQRKMNWFKVMWKKYREGTFDPVKAEIGFGHLTTEAARKYNSQHDPEYHISTSVRKVTNKGLVAEFIVAAKNKEYDFMR